MGPSSTFPIIVPNIYFWDAHYALAYRVARPLALSVEVNTTIQLNQLDTVMFPQLNHMRAVSVVPAVQVHLGRYRVDLIARIGLTPGRQPAGVSGLLGDALGHSAGVAVVRLSHRVTVGFGDDTPALLRPFGSARGRPPGGSGRLGRRCRLFVGRRQDGRPDAAGDGISFDWRFGDLPQGCPPAAGNEKNVGKPCSVGGKECSGGLICACEPFAGIMPPADTPCFCTIPILGKTCSDPTIPANYCGTGRDAVVAT